MNQATCRTDLPAATIVVASYGRPQKIKDCVARLITLDYPAFEILVVDDGSPEPIAQLLSEYGPRVRVVRRDNAGPAAARNHGVAQAAHDFILFTDDDCLPRNNWIKVMAAAHVKSPDALLGGLIENGLPHDIYASSSQGLCDYLYGYYQAGAGNAPFFTTNNLAFSKKRFLDVGGLDGSFRFASEDRDFGMRWGRYGLPMVYVPEAVVDHYHDMTLPAYWRQHASYGAGAKKLHHTMDARGDARPKVEPFSFYLGILAHPFKTRARAMVRQSFLMGLSQVAMVWGYYRATVSPPDAEKTPRGNDLYMF